MEKLARHLQFSELFPRTDGRREGTDGEKGLTERRD